MRLQRFSVALRRCTLSGRQTIQAMVLLAERDTSLARLAALYLITYIFLLRLPSEALPITTGRDSSGNALFIENSQLVLVLARRWELQLYSVDLHASHIRRTRKNKPRGSRLTRGCWCSESMVRRDTCEQVGARSAHTLFLCFEATCPVHVVGRIIDEVEPGTALFQGLSATVALQQLHVMLEAVGVDKAMTYRCHDIRRGHALDLQLSGTLQAQGDARGAPTLRIARRAVA